MLNNDVIRSIRYILKINDQKILEIFKLSGDEIVLKEVQSFMLREDEVGYQLCSDSHMAHFLDGLIFFKRGKDDTKPRFPFELPISNNLIIKKLKVAFTLNEDRLHEIMNLSEYPISRSEMSAFFRKKDHPNYRECGDQILRYFLKGLTISIHNSN